MREWTLVAQHRPCRVCHVTPHSDGRGRCSVTIWSESSDVTSHPSTATTWLIKAGTWNDAIGSSLSCHNNSSEGHELTRLWTSPVSLLHLCYDYTIDLIYTILTHTSSLTLTSWRPLNPPVLPTCLSQGSGRSVRSCFISMGVLIADTNKTGLVNSGFTA